MKKKKAKYIMFLLGCLSIITSISCLFCSIFSYVTFKALREENIDSYLENTLEIENYKVEYDHYLRVRAYKRVGFEYDEDGWLDITGHNSFEKDDVFRGNMHFDSIDYESNSEFAYLDRSLFGKIDYEDSMRSRDWEEIDRYNKYQYQKNEFEVMQLVSDYDSILEAIFDNADSKVVRKKFPGNEYYVDITDKEEVVSDYIYELLSTVDHTTSGDLYKLDVNVSENDVWTTVKLENNVITEIKFYFDKVELEIDYYEYELEGGFTLKISDIDKVKVEEPDIWLYD